MSTKFIFENEQNAEQSEGKDFPVAQPGQAFPHSKLTGFLKNTVRNQLAPGE
jgi:hypothetical protein